MLKILYLFTICTLLICFSLCLYGQDKIVHPIKPKDFDGLGLTNDFKVLAQGSQSKVDQPFIFVARDEKTYAQLQNLVDGLPSVTTIDFTKNAVVAGFAGTHSTGGWTVEIRKSVDQVGVFIQAPRKGEMVTQVITTPFRVSLVPVEDHQALRINPDKAFMSRSQKFSVSQSNFEFSGGFAGIKRNFKVVGTLRLLTFGNYLTISFDLKSKDKKRKLVETISGILTNNKIEIERLDAGSFADSPKPPLEVVGTLKGQNLSMSFEPLPTTVADGSQVRGNLDAIKAK